MADADWSDVWRAWLYARFEDRLDDAALKSAIADCESLRRLWEPLWAYDEDNGEAPFPYPLPPFGPGSAEDA